MLPDLTVPSLHGRASHVASAVTQQSPGQVRLVQALHDYDDRCPGIFDPAFQGVLEPLDHPAPDGVAVRLIALCGSSMTIAPLNSSRILPAPKPVIVPPEPVAYLTPPSVVFQWWPASLANSVPGKISPDLALLTGQRIGDLIKMRWQDVTEDGLLVEQGKTKQRLMIQWSPALRAAIEACNRGDKIGHVLKTQSGRGYQYTGIRSAWVRACERAGIKDLNIHDLRGRAGMDAREAGSLEAAKELLGHKSIRMAEHYVDGKAPRKAKPSR